MVLPGSNLSHKIVKKDQVLTPSMISRMCSAYQLRKGATTELFKDEMFGIAGKDFKRCDVVCDRYFEGSPKEGVRYDRGSGTKSFLLVFLKIS